MTPAVRLLLQLLLVSLVSGSHYLGASTTFKVKGRNPDGTFRVDIRNKASFHWCSDHHMWHCSSGNCGNVVKTQRGEIERNTRSSYYNTPWCEKETVLTVNSQSDKPFEMSEESCCWISTSNSNLYWRLQTHVDLGTRSDSGKPNAPPDIGIIPFLRTPKNCPRTYKLMSFDQDGDHVRCRYGRVFGRECHKCSQPTGFYLDQDLCTLYHNTSNSGVYGFELVVEDFPQRPITLAYTDESHSTRWPLPSRARRKRASGILTGYNTSVPYTTNVYFTTATTSPHAKTTSITKTTTMYPVTTYLSVIGSTTYPVTTVTPTSTTTHHITTPTTTVPTTASSSYSLPVTTYKSMISPTTIMTSSAWTTATSQQPTRAAGTTTAYSWGAPTTSQHPTTTPSRTTATSWGSTATTQHPTTTTSTTVASTWGSTSTTQHPTTKGLTTTAFSSRTTTILPQSTTSPGRTTTSSSWTTTTLQGHAATTTSLTTTTSPTTATGPLNLSPISQLPLQFSFSVDPDVPSCQEGVYLPKLIPPTPEDGARLKAEVNKELEIRIKAQSSASMLQDLIISGPLNITKHRPTRSEFAINWTPVPDDLGLTFAICFVVESVSGSYVYQSEMRCVVADVGRKQVELHVLCHESSMRVELERSKLPGLRDDQLQLSDPGNTVCSLQTHSNSTHVVAVVPLNACGTQIEEDDDNLIFKNELTTVETAGSLITRKHMFEVQFYCQYPKRGNVTLSFTVHRKNVTIWERGFGMFTYQSEFYPNDQFQIRIDPNSYPLEFEIGTLIHMQIEAVSTVNNTELFVESCRASPYDNPNYPSTYVIIENGCQVDPTIKIHPPAHNKQFRFSMEAFKFIGLHDLVYISCSVMMCEAGNLDTRCSQGCIKSNSTNSRPKREAAIQTARHFVSQGPLRLRRSSERAQSPVTNLNLNLVFIAGCFLAVVGMISAAVVHKSRTPKIKYQLLPAAEN